MASLDIASWLENREALALRVDSKQLRGIFTKELRVPGGVFGLIRHEERGKFLADEHTEVRGSFTGVLVKDGDIALPLNVDGLKTREGFDAEAALWVVLRFVKKVLDLEEMETHLMGSASVVTVDELIARFQASIRHGLARLLAQLSAEDLYLKDLRDALHDRLAHELRAPTFETGLEHLDTRNPAFRCPAYEELRQQNLEVKLKQEELKQRQQLIEAERDFQKNRAIQEQKFAEWQKQLEVKGIVKELELQAELDRRRREEKVARYRELVGEFEGDELKAQIMLIEDEKVRARLLESVIEREMSEHQIKARRDNLLEQKLEERLRKMELMMAERLKLGGLASGASRERTRRVLCVVGKKVVAYDPTTNVNPRSPKEEYDFEGRGLGYLRSVRTGGVNGQEMLLVGAQGGVYAVTAGGEIKSFAFQSAPSGRGGVNAVAYYGGYLYGSHSELGVVRWDLSGIGRAVPMFPDLTHGSETTRGVFATPKGLLYFASGSVVYRANLMTGEDPVAYEGNTSSITSLSVTPDYAIAGNKNGQIFAWRHVDPKSPQLLNIRLQNPVYMLKALKVAGGTTLLVGGKSFSVTSLLIEGQIANEYRAPEQIRWVDGAPDYVVGVSRSGYQIHVWETGRYARNLEDKTIRVLDRIQDIWVQRYEGAEA